MFQYYHVIKDPNNLPTGAFFIDPQDGEKYIVKDSETLEQFTKRVVTSREKLNNVPINQSELNMLINISLSNTTPEIHKGHYFDQVASHVSMRQLVSAAVTMSSQLLSGTAATFNVRQERAKKCFSCPFHNKKGMIGRLASNILNTVAGMTSIEALSKSDYESKLGACGMCGCGLQAKIRYDIYPIIAGVEPENIAKPVRTFREDVFDKCWIFSDALKDARAKKLLIDKLNVVKISLEDLVRYRNNKKISEAKNNGVKKS